MKYSPRLPQTNPNVSEKSPMKEFLKDLGAIFLALIGLYILLGFFVGILAQKMPFSFEMALGKAFSSPFTEMEQDEKREEVQSLLDELASLRPGDAIPVKVYVVKEDTVNAMALPGGTIVVFTGLLDKIEGEEELAFVLCHEMGHFAGRDHLKGMGRALVLQSLVVFVTGGDSGLASSLALGMQGMETKFSQSAETAADRYALEILKKRYHRVDGATGFMSRLAEKEKQGKLAYYFASHPHPEDRLKEIRAFAAHMKK